MDLIRIFAETAFAEIADRYCDNFKDTLENDVGSLLIDEPIFVDECRVHHKELSDDQIRMIYGLYRDEWSLQSDNSDVTGNGNKSIFSVIFQLANELLRNLNGLPKVRFQHLFRWREISQVLGEDIFTSAILAYHKRDLHSTLGKFPNFEKIPSVIHNDNPHLQYIFKTVGLSELHSHLKAATDTFSISWVCLMNHISRRNSQFEKLAEIQDPSRKEYISNKIYSATAEAAFIRFSLWRFLTDENMPIPEITTKYAQEEYRIELDNKLVEQRKKPNDFDYIYVPDAGNMSVFVGERKFLFLMFDKILRTDDIRLHRMFYRYILRKNQLRSFLVQINGNTGFNNFKRFQDLKATFLIDNYKDLLTTLPVWEAAKFNYTKIYEARIAPVKNIQQFELLYNKIKKELNEMTDIDVSILFHFIKEMSKKDIDMNARDFELRYKNLYNSININRIHDLIVEKSITSGIDAASSELYCRPEVFAQAYRFLKSHGYYATFHVGEDFYDLADGLRAIFESILFLELEAGDRIGHAIALGLDPIKFYSTRHNYIAIPQQWMLDNVVWLYFYSREHNVILAPTTEDFLLTTYKKLILRIGYRSIDSDNIDISDYYQSILLRGDNPNYYKKRQFDTHMQNSFLPDGESWQSFDLQMRKRDIVEIRKYNPIAARLYSDYHFDIGIRRKGALIKSFLLPEGYPNLISELQNKMIREVSKCHLGIECCPSSNFKIGHLEKFENHPIFRFMPVHESESRYPLAVTVNTDDLGIFATSLPNEFSLLALALLKKKDINGNRVYSSQEVYDWIKRIVENGHKYHFQGY